MTPTKAIIVLIILFSSVAGIYYFLYKKNQVFYTAKTEVVIDSPRPEDPSEQKKAELLKVLEALNQGGAASTTQETEEKKKEMLEALSDINERGQVSSPEESEAKKLELLRVLEDLNKK